MNSMLFRMKGIKDWISDQIAASNSLLSVRPLTGNVAVDHASEELNRAGSAGAAIAAAALPETSTNSGDAEVRTQAALLTSGADGSHISHFSSLSRKLDPLSKVDALQINFLRIIQRLGISPQDLVVTQVLHRLQLACLIRAQDADISVSSLKHDKASSIARNLERDGQADLDFSLKILLLGRTGTGKSATMNSIFGDTKAPTSAFHPATGKIREVTGFVNGMKVTVIDTPGLLPSGGNQHRNMKTLLSIKKFIKRSKPDMVLYFERLDLMNAGYSDFALLKLVTDVFGSALWFNTMIIMTHGASGPPEGSDGVPVGYGDFISWCTTVIQHYTRQAARDKRLENPVLIVENHPSCRRNISGEKVLPNGQIWRSQFLLMCVATKVLGDVNAIFKFRDILPLSQPNLATPSLPHLLSSFLRPCSESPNEELDKVVDLDEEDEYDQLPPIKILNKAQFERLSRDQQSAYLDELDYRETLYLKKQWKEELRKRRDDVISQNSASTNDVDYESNSNPELVLLPDMSIPLSFDSDNPVHRYRCLVSDNSRWVVRPILDSHGWDHGVGFDGINVEVSEDIRSDFHTTLVGQLNKEKDELSFQAECTASYKDLKGWPALNVALDLQSSGKNLVSAIRGDARLRTWKYNVAGCGISVTSFGNKYYIGTKLEDSILVGRRLEIAMNAGRLVGNGQLAYGGGLETTFKGKDYPARNDKISFAMTSLTYDKETVYGGNVQSDLRVTRNLKASLNVNMNSRKMGKFSVKIGSTGEIEFVVVALCSIIGIISRLKPSENAPAKNIEEI